VKGVFILLFTLAPLLCVPGQDTNLLSRLEPVPPFPELRTAAKTNDISLAGISLITGTNVLPGDSLTALITLHQKRNRFTQWLVYFEVITNPPPLRPPKPVVLYNSLGDKFEFPNVPVTFRIRTIGPFVNSASIWGAPVTKDNSARASVNGAFLSLGLEQCMAALYRIDALAQKTGATNVYIETEDKPFPDKTINKTQKLVAPLHITLQERRALATGEPALTSYFEAVGETPDLEGMMWKVISLPSVWSMVKHRGVTATLDIDVHNIRPLSLPPGWNMPGRGPVYGLPMSVTLNGKPALDVSLMITSPSPSLVACGGIVGFVAQNPNDEENYLTLRIISAAREKRGADIKGK